jgi:hypothetical protein
LGKTEGFGERKGRSPRTSRDREQNERGPKKRLESIHTKKHLQILHVYVQSVRKGVLAHLIEEKEERGSKVRYHGKSM